MIAFMEDNNCCNKWEMVRSNRNTVPQLDIRSLATAGSIAHEASAAHVGQKRQDEDKRVASGTAHSAVVVSTAYLPASAVAN